MSGEYENIIIGGIEIPRYANSEGFSQTYDELAGISARRTLGGTLLPQRSWPLTRNFLWSTTISGVGSLPAGIDQLDRGVAYEVECAEVRHISGGTHVITLPAGRRSGGIYAPRGFALVSGLLVETSIAIVGDVATLGVVSGAQHYRVSYWPKFTGVLTHKSDGEPWRATRRWTITIEEEGE
jgi:hypothetical protein